ncbi:MAG: hypothetical protein HKN77_06785 [Woeseiaceae bacterium]|nr:hypothetical protein [Woeseiaceae bacterium]
MKQCIENCPPPVPTNPWLGGKGPRIPGKKKHFKLRWKDAFGVLIGPAERMHHLRNLRSAMFYEAVDQQDKHRDD